MKINVPVVEKLRAWQTPAKYRAREAEYATAQQHMVDRLKAYAETGRVGGFSQLTNRQEWAPQPSRSAYLYLALHVVARLKVIESYQVSAQESMRAGLASAVLCSELSSLLEFLLEVEFPSRFGRKRRGLLIDAAGWVGLAAAAGAMEVVDRWAPLLVRAVKDGYVLDDSKKGLQHFTLRLWCAAHAQDYPDTGFPRYEVAEGVLRMWNTPDVEALGEWLVQLCNQHTRLTTSRDFMDFSGEFSHFPVEVLMLFRLREQIGLANPEVDHPLMKFPWSRLWPVQPAQPDELLTGAYRRLEQDEGISLDGLYRQFLGAPDASNE